MLGPGGKEFNYFLSLRWEDERKWWRSPKWFLWDLNELLKMMLLVEISTESIYRSKWILTCRWRVGLSEYQARMWKPAVLYWDQQSCYMAMIWRFATSGYAEVWLRSLALGTRLASGLGRARQKYVFVPYRELAYVTCPHEWRIIVAQWGKNLNRVKNDLSFEWEWCIYVQLVWILTTIKRKSVVESGEK